MFNQKSLSQEFITVKINCLHTLCTKDDRLAACDPAPMRESFWLAQGLQYRISLVGLVCVLSLFKKLFIYLFLAVLDLCFCTGFSPVVASRDLLSICDIHGLLIVVISRVDHGLWGMWAPVVVTHGLGHCGPQVLTPEPPGKPWALFCFPQVSALPITSHLSWTTHSCYLPSPWGHLSLWCMIHTYRTQWHFIFYFFPFIFISWRLVAL